VLEIDGTPYVANVGSPSAETTVADLTVVDCGKMLTAQDCVSPPTTPWACLIQRGDLTFVGKYQNCVAAGAKGMIIFNNDANDANAELSASFGDEKTAIPVLCVTRATGETIKSTLLGKTAKLGAPKKATKSGVFMPLTHRKDQGSCGDCCA
jgi:hypothetical protein